MSTNLRLPADLAEALRNAAAERGQSQQHIVREAIAKELGLSQPETAMSQAVRVGLVKAPTSFQDVVPEAELPQGRSVLDLLERDDR